MNEGSIDIDALDREIGARIRHVRMMRGLTQKDLGEALGVSFQQIQKYERGMNRVSTSALILLARALDVSPDALIRDDAPAPNLEWALLSEDGAHELLKLVSQINSPERRRVVLDVARALGRVAGGR